MLIRRGLLLTEETSKGRKHGELQITQPWRSGDSHSSRISFFHSITTLHCKSSDFGLAVHTKMLKPLLFRALALPDTVGGGALGLYTCQTGTLVHTLALECSAFILLFAGWIDNLFIYNVVLKRPGSGGRWLALPLTEADLGKILASPGPHFPVL